MGSWEEETSHTLGLSSVSGDGETLLDEDLDASKSELVEAVSFGRESSGENGEGLELDFSGCVWNSSVCEIPTWTESFRETVSENVDNDVVFIPNLSTPHKGVASNTAKVIQGDENESVPEAVSMSKMKVSLEEAPVISSCNCCLCTEPVNFVLPAVNCNILSKEKVEFSNIVDSTRVTGKLKDRYKLPAVDPIFDPSKVCKTTEVEIMSFLVGVYVDIIPKDLAHLWSQIIGRSVQAPERFGITSLTQPEMLHLKKKFLSEQSDSDSIKNVTCQGSKEEVSTCMSSSLVT